MTNRNTSVLVAGLGVFGVAFVALSIFLTWVSTPHQEVGAYSIPRMGSPIEAPEAQLKPARLLGAIVPAEDKVWFFKVLTGGSMPDAVKEKFLAFLNTVEIPPEGERKPIIWKAPPRWKQEPSRMVGGIKRFATIWMTDVDGGPIEIAVSELPTRPNGLQMNLNRWRKQVSLPPLRHYRDIEDEVTRIKRPFGEILIADMKGKADLSGFAAPPRARAEEPLPVSYDVPENWAKEAPRDEFTAVAYSVTGKDDALEAFVTITAFPGDGGGWTSNVLRWRDQLGLDPADPKAINEQTKLLEVDGLTARLIELSNPKPKGPAATILAAAVFLEWDVYFVKMIIRSADPTPQRAQFETFLRSWKFKSPKGA